MIEARGIIRDQGDTHNRPYLTVMEDRWRGPDCRPTIVEAMDLVKPVPVCCYQAET